MSDVKIYQGQEKYGDCSRVQEMKRGLEVMDSGPGEVCGNWYSEYCTSDAYGVVIARTSDSQLPRAQWRGRGSRWDTETGLN